MTLLEAVVASICILSAKRNQPASDEKVRDAWLKCFERNGVTVEELEKAVAWHDDNSPFFPDHSEILKTIQAQKQEWPSMGVLVASDTMAHLKAPTVYELEERAREMYFEAWGCLPADGRFDCAPRREIEAKKVSALPEPKVKEIPDLEDPEQEERIRRQIDAIKRGDGLG